jgi:arylsulfatase A-like enzyme
VLARLFAAIFVNAAFCAAQTPVILISIDTLRADHLSAYGYRRIKTPNIDSFAEHGTLYSAIEAQIPLTLPSHTSLFTSTYPFQNRIEENAEHVPPGQVTLAGVLRDHGYQTAAFIGSVFLERELGLDQGFETYDSPFHFTAFSPISGSMFFGDNRPSPSVREKRDGALVVRAASQWLASHRGQPVFAFLHLFDLHKPYDPHTGVSAPPGHDNGYDTELAYLDGLLGAFKKTLVDGGWWDRSVVVLLSDHGESLGEHGEASHGVFIYQSTVWVPLLIHWPASMNVVPARVTDPAGLIDVAPTILDALRVPSPPSFVGASLLRKSSPRVLYAESLHTHDSFGWAPLRSVRLGKYKYIEAPRPELYDLDVDPHELNNIYRKSSPLQAQLRDLLARYTPKAPAPAQAVSPQTKALLGSLGYLAGSPKPVSPSGGADPKDRLPELQLYEKSQVLLYYGRREEAIALLQRILKLDPQNTLARRDLGATFLDRKEYAQACAEFAKVLAVAPGDYMTEFEMGIAEEHRGLLKEAIAHVETACRIAPEAVQCRAELAKLKKDGRL